MSQQTGKISQDPLFLALTRPAMIFGITYSWFMLNALVWMLYFIATSDFSLTIPGALIVHFVGVLTCNHEPRFMDIVRAWGMANTRCLNKHFHGNTSSYDVY